MFVGVEVRALCRSVKFFHTDHDKPFFVWTFVHGGIVMLKKERVCGTTESSRKAVYAVALTFPFTATKRPSLKHEKQPQTIIPAPPNFTVGTMVVFSWHSPNPDSSIKLPDGEA